jgi:hypothetical protein
MIRSYICIRFAILCNIFFRESRVMDKCTLFVQRKWFHAINGSSFFSVIFLSLNFYSCIALFTFTIHKRAVHICHGISTTDRVRQNQACIHTSENDVFNKYHKEKITSILLHKQCTISKDDPIHLLISLFSIRLFTFKNKQLISNSFVRFWRVLNMFTLITKSQEYTLKLVN